LKPTSGCVGPPPPSTASSAENHNHEASTTRTKPATNGRPLEERAVDRAKNHPKKCSVFACLRISVNQWKLVFQKIFVLSLFRRVFVVKKFLLIFWL